MTPPHEFKYYQSEVQYFSGGTLLQEELINHIDNYLTRVALVGFSS